jgi:hypothetical protein
MPRSFQYTSSSDLLGIVPLSDFTVKPVFAHAGAVEFPHDKSVFFNEIKNGLVFVRNSVEPLVLVNVTLDDVNLSIKNVMEMFAFVEHRTAQDVSAFVEIIAFLAPYGKRRGEREQKPLQDS